jgi:hypothetical protein
VDPTQTPEINYDVTIGRKRPFCQVNPEPVPLDAPFNTAFDSESLGRRVDPGEPALLNQRPVKCRRHDPCALEVFGAPVSFLCRTTGIAHSGRGRQLVLTPAVPCRQCRNPRAANTPGTIPGTRLSALTHQRG